MSPRVKIISTQTDQLLSCLARVSVIGSQCTSSGNCHAHLTRRDPLGWTLAITLVFLAVILVRLTIPSQPYYDEVHYLPATRAFLDLSNLLNPEHPPLGKILIGVGMVLFGDTPFGWRIMPALFGALGFFAFMRAMWFASGSRFTTIASGILLATAFPLFVQSRIAMLDIFMTSFVLIGLWMYASALREGNALRWRLAGVGAAMGLAMAIKWSAIPFAMLPGLVFLLVKISSSGRKPLVSSKSLPILNITILEAAFWLGLLPLIIYSISYLPLAFLEKGAISPAQFFKFHYLMFELQSSVVETHPYMSNWYQWVINQRPIWFLYQDIDGAYRGILFIGNPLTMLLGLPALLWCFWTGLKRRIWDRLAVSVLYAVGIGFWIVAAKPIQFYYHYLLPSCFLIAALALVLEAFWKKGWRTIPVLILAASCALFIYFYPILSAAPLTGPYAFLNWMWLDSWR